MSGIIQQGILKLHHVGIVVPNVVDTVEKYLLLCGEDKSVFFEKVISQKVQVAVIGDGVGPYLEYIEPLGKDSPVYEFAQNGGGLHHLCFSVDDIDEAGKLLSPYYRRITSIAMGLMGKPMAFYFAKVPVFGVELIEVIEIKPL